MQRVLIIIKSQLINHSYYQELLMVFDMYDINVVVIPTEYEKHAINIAKENATKFDVFIAVGGDGTIHEVVNGVMQTEQPPAIALVPLGTGNDFARMLESITPLELVARVTEKNTNNIDLIQVKDDNQTAFAVNALDIGFGAEVVQKMETNPNRRLSYARAILKTFVKFKAQLLNMILNETESSSKTLMFVVANGKYFGNGLAISPDSSCNDRKLNFVHIGDVSLWEYIRNLGRLKKGKKLNHKEVRYGLLDHLKVLNDNPVNMELDGEYYQFLSPEITLSEKSISLLNPIK